MTLDQREPLLVVTCTVESTTVGDDGRARKETQPQHRAVRVPRMPAGYDDCVALAEELVVSTSSGLGL